MLSKSITKLVQYGMETGLVPECEKNYTINLLLDVFHEDEYVEPEENFSDVDLEETLNELLDEDLAWLERLLYEGSSSSSSYLSL